MGLSYYEKSPLDTEILRVYIRAASMKPARHKALLIKVTPAERKRAKKVARNLKKSVSEIVRNTFRFLDDQSKRKAA